jgi:hypothetical protein
MSAVLKVPKNAESSIILKWKKYRITKTLGAGWLAKPSNWDRRALVREKTKVTLI